MKVKKEFKGQIHFFDLPEALAKKYVSTDKRYSFLEDEKNDTSDDRPKRAYTRRPKEE